jgi:hypothetical protein
MGSRVIQSVGADGLTTGQRGQLATDRQIKKERLDSEAANKLAQIDLQNQGQQNATFLTQVGANVRQGMADKTAVQTTNTKELAETDRNTATNQGAMDRLVTGHGQTMAQLAEQEKYTAAGDQRKTGAALVAAGVPGEQVNRLMNPNPGFPTDYTGIQAPLKNNQVDNFQFITRDVGVGQQEVLAGNRQLGTVSPVSALANPSTTAQPKAGAAQSPAPSAAGAQQTRATGLGPQPVQQESAAPNAFAQVYAKKPERLQEDANFAYAQLGTVYKTKEEADKYLDGVKVTNPMLYDAVAAKIMAQAQASQQAGRVSR